jgi:hypothetical protein
VEDADEAVGEPPEGVVVGVPGGALLVVNGAGARGGAQGGLGLGCRAPASRLLCT